MTKYKIDKLQESDKAMNSNKQPTIDLKAIYESDYSELYIPIKEVYNKLSPEEINYFLEIKLVKAVEAYFNFGNSDARTYIRDYENEIKVTPENKKDEVFDKHINHYLNNIKRRNDFNYLWNDYFKGEYSYDLFYKLGQRLVSIAFAWDEKLINALYLLQNIYANYWTAHGLNLSKEQNTFLSETANDTPNLLPPPGKERDPAKADKKVEDINQPYSNDQQKEYIRSILAPLGGHSPTKQRIMSEKDFNRLIDYTDHLIFTNSLPDNISLIAQTNISNEHIRYTFYRLHKHLFGTNRIRAVFINFLHSVFTQFKETATTTTKAKFSTAPKSYNSDFAGYIGDES